MGHGRAIYPPGGGGAGGNFSAGVSTLGNTLGTTGMIASQLLFVGSNNMTLSQSVNGNSATISFFGGAGGVAISGGTQLATSGTVNWANSNGISFGLSGSTQMTASYTVPSTAGLISAINFSAGTTSNNSAAINFANGGGVSFGLNAGTITATVATNYLTAQSNPAFSADASSTFQTLVFQNSNGVSFSNNLGAIRLTHDLQFISGTSNITSNALHSSASRVFNVIAATNNAGAGTASLSSNVSFSAANGATFYTSAGNAIALSYTVPTVPAQTNQTLGIYATSQTTGVTGTSTYDARSLTFRGAGIVSIGHSAGEIIISAVGGGAGDGANILAAGTQTANTTGTVKFADSNGYTFGMSNNTQVTINGPTLKYFEPHGAVHSQAVVAGTLPMQNIQVPFNINATQLNMMLAHTNSSSAGNTLVFSVGIYTMSGSTASLASSASLSFQYNSTLAASSYTNYSGTRMFSFALGTWNITPGNYLLAFNCASTTALTAGTFSYLINRSNYTLAGEPGGGANYTKYFGNGFFSASSAALMGSAHLTNINQTANLALRQPWYAMAGAL